MTKTILKTIKLYLKPNKTTTKRLNEILFGCNFLYNQLLKEMIKRDKREIKQPNLSEWSKTLTKLRKENNCLQTVNRQILNEVIMRVRKTWNNYLRNKKLGLKKGYPRIKQLHRYNSFVGTNNQNWKLENNKIVLSQERRKGGNGSEKITLKISWSRSIEGDIQTLIIKRKNNRWYALFVSEVEITERISTGKYIAGDLNCKKDAYCVLSNGIRLEHPQVHKKAEVRLVKAQRVLSKKELGSKNRNKARLLYSKQWEKVKNQQRDAFFKMVKEFEQYDGFVREDLKIVNMLKNKKLAKAIARCSWGNFNNILADRAEEAGRQLVKVSPYNTTQRCSNCGEIARDKLTLTNRTFNCWNCSFELDRDVNSARNILDKAIQENKFNIGLGFSLCREATGVALLKQEICNLV